MTRQRPSANYRNVAYKPRDLLGTPYEELRAATGVPLSDKPVHSNGTVFACDECGHPRGYAENDVQQTCTWTDHDGAIGPIVDSLEAGWCETRAYACARWEIQGHDLLDHLAKDPCARVRATMVRGLAVFFYTDILERLADDESIMVRRAMWGRRDRLPRHIAEALAVEFSGSGSAVGRQR